MQGTANLNVMVQAARKAGRSLVKDFREVENLQVGSKGPGDFVSRADLASEKILRDDLMGARKTYGWLAEESGPEVKGEDPTRRWIVDPLDGTSNFLHGTPHWAVSLALEHKGEIVAAVVFDAAKDEMFIAEKGSGAWLNDSRLRVSGRTRLQESLLATSVPFGAKKTLPATMHDLAQLMPQSAGVRCWGAASLDLCYVAAGRYDACWARELSPWDLSAGILLVREAGGFVEPLRKDGDILGSGALVAAAPGVFDSFAKVLRSR